MTEPTYTAEQQSAENLCNAYKVIARQHVALTAAEEREKELQEDRDSCVEKNRQLVANNERLGKLVDEACDAGEKSESRVEELQAQLAAIRDAPLPEMPEAYRYGPNELRYCAASEVERVFLILTRKMAALEDERKPDAAE